MNAIFFIFTLGAAPGKEVDRWFIAHAASFPGKYIIDQPHFQVNNYQIDGILLASSKFDQRRLVTKKRQNNLNE